MKQDDLDALREFVERVLEWEMSDTSTWVHCNFCGGTGLMVSGPTGSTPHGYRPSADHPPKHTLDCLYIKVKNILGLT